MKMRRGMAEAQVRSSQLLLLLLQVHTFTDIHMCSCHLERAPKTVKQPPPHSSLHSSLA